MKAKMICFDEEQHNNRTPMFDNIYDALFLARGTYATFVSRGEYFNGREDWIMQTINCEKVFTTAALTILRNSFPILERAGYEGLPKEEAIEWFESQYSLCLNCPKAKLELAPVDGPNGLCLKGIEQGTKVSDVRKFASDCFHKSAIYIISCFLKSRCANGYLEDEYLKDEIQNIQTIEEEIDRHII